MAGRYGIRRVPLHLTVDGVDYSDGVDEVPDDIVRVPGVSTSGANPHEIGEVFARAPRNEPCPCGSGRKAKHCHGR